MSILYQNLLSSKVGTLLKTFSPVLLITLSIAEMMRALLALSTSTKTLLKELVGIEMMPPLENASHTIYKMKRDKVTYVSTCGLQRRSNKANQVQMKHSNHQHFMLNTSNHRIKQY